MMPGSVAPAVRDHTATTDDTPTPQAWVQRFLETGEEESRRHLLHALRTLPGPDVESRLASLKEESLRFLSVDPHKALVLAEALIAGAGVVGRPDHRALGLMAKGDAVRVLGRYPESFALLEEAGDAFVAQGNELGWARTR